MLENVRGMDELELAIHGELICLSLYSSQFLGKLASSKFGVYMSGFLTVQPCRVSLQF